MENKKQILLVVCLLLNGMFVFSQGSSNVLDGIYIKEHTPGRKPISYASNGPYGSSLIREANVMWLRRIWRRIDLREKINHPLYYPTDPIQDRKSLFDLIKTSIMEEGTITAYDPGALGDDDEFTLPMPVDSIKALLFEADTVYTEDLDGNIIAELQTTERKSSDVKLFEVKEEWFFDRERSVMDVRIIGMSPVIALTDELSGDFKGYSRMFWVYFPQARYVFANHTVFNPNNDAERRTFEDIFWKRQFGSYITKRSNVYDRYISEYRQGLDALLEAEKIKDELFVMEHDLWHY
ncbi:MAG: gliding motility protein GldN [Flavobacteriales bacterium]